ncbi:hypothetical protein DFH09DRAFT_55946 [Mycena vulgaris]|nr:hypothetical protein DFH09DRAFT_55946 [Mycena vulgaris]
MTLEQRDAISIVVVAYYFPQFLRINLDISTNVRARRVGQDPRRQPLVSPHKRCVLPSPQGILPFGVVCEPRDRHAGFSASVLRLSVCGEESLRSFLTRSSCVFPFRGAGARGSPRRFDMSLHRSAGGWCGNASIRAASLASSLPGHAFHFRFHPAPRLDRQWRAEAGGDAWRGYCLLPWLSLLHCLRRYALATPILCRKWPSSCTGIACPSSIHAPSRGVLPLGLLPSQLALSLLLSDPAFDPPAVCIYGAHGNGVPVDLCMQTGCPQETFSLLRVPALTAGVTGWRLYMSRECGVSGGCLPEIARLWDNSCCVASPECGECRRCGARAYGRVVVRRRPNTFYVSDSALTF